MKNRFKIVVVVLAFVFMGCFALVKIHHQRVESARRFINERPRWYDCKYLGKAGSAYKFNCAIVTGPVDTEDVEIESDALLKWSAKKR